jgi:RpiB/LacA/LacB family sugar-phosphate isomerase
MKIVLGADYAGFELKERIKLLLLHWRHDVIDLGTHTGDPVDPPDFAEAVGSVVQDRKGSRGILVCGSGVGASIALNKIPDVRAGLCHDCDSMREGVEHNNMNVMVISGAVIDEAVALELVPAFLQAQYRRAPRGNRRLRTFKASEPRFSIVDKNMDEVTPEIFSIFRHTATD